jgi:polysaccharide biosynthesis/export protein
VFLFALACAVVLSTVPAGPAVAQERIPGSPDPTAMAPGALEDRRLAPLLDAPVDRAAYVLGPGDRLELSLIGELSRSYTLSVTPEGTLVVPAMGVLDVRGRSLDEAQQGLRQLVARYHRNVDVHLSLTEVRRFRVFVVGDVPSRGAREATAMTRVSELISADAETAVPRRNITIRRLNGDSVFADLRRFNQTGDLSANPLLREGDVIGVSSIDRTVQVVGRVAFPGTYEYRHGETLASLLTVANGGSGFPSDAGDTVRLSRFIEEEQRQVIALPRAEAVGSPGEQLVLEPFDAIAVPWISNYREQTMATITGQVAQPGPYPIRPDTTTIRELLQMAGGFTKEASVVQATLRRDAGALGNAALERLAAVPDELRTPEERRILQIGMSGDQSRVVTDFEAIFLRLEDAFDQTLSAGDSIDVPRRREEVLVLGAVLRPGIVSHQAGMNVSSFVDRAGGYGRRADRGGLVVLRAQTGARVSAREARTIDPGDAIIVPYRERMRPLQVLQTTGLVVSSVTSMVLAYIAIFNR